MTRQAVFASEQSERGNLVKLKLKITMNKIYLINKVQILALGDILTFVIFGMLAYFSCAHFKKLKSRALWGDEFFKKNANFHTRWGLDNHLL